MIFNVNNENTVYNIYGDINQRLKPSGLKKWDLLDDSIINTKFSLNENYRNSTQIIDFCNTQLSCNDVSMGIDTQNVKYCNIDDLIWMIKLQLFLNNRVAVIAQNKGIIPNRVNNCFGENKNIMIGEVGDFKGLEFETVFAFDAYMSKNEKYITYTRAINELYIINK